VFLIREHEFAASWWAALKGGLGIRAGCTLVLSSVAYAENLHGGFVQGNMVVICIWCVLFVTSQYDVIFMFPNQRFGEVC